MRITSGILKNRTLNTLDVDFRPTMESVREAIFSSLGGNCNQKKFLDLFAGSGAVGLEAWSRGASQIYLIEKDKELADQLSKIVIRFNQDQLGEVKVENMDVIDWLKKTTCKFDIVFADPPYNLIDDFKIILDAIYDSSILTSESILVYELRNKEKIIIDKKWDIVREKRYGKTKILFLRKA